MDLPIDDINHAQFINWSFFPGENYGSGYGQVQDIETTDDFAQTAHSAPEEGAPIAEISEPIPQPELPDSRIEETLEFAASAASTDLPTDAITGIAPAVGTVLAKGELDDDFPAAADSQIARWNVWRAVQLDTGSFIKTRIDRIMSSAILADELFNDGHSMQARDDLPEVLTMVATPEAFGVRSASTHQAFASENTFWRTDSTASISSHGVQAAMFSVSATLPPGTI